MKWNFNLNGRKVSYQLSDNVAIAPQKIEHPRRDREKSNGKEPGNAKHHLDREQQALDASQAIQRPYHEREKANGREPANGNRSKNREQQALNTFRQAGWDFTPLGQLPPPPDDDGGGTPDKRDIRQVFTNRHGDVLIETDVATVQLNAAATTKLRTAQKVLAEDGLSIIKQLSFAPYLYTVRLPRGRSLPETINALQAKTHRYVFAEPSMLQRISGRQAPNDPQLGMQWQHEGINGLQSLDAWEIATGAGVRIAIIDNGMQIDHQDLRAGIVGGGYFESTGPATATTNFVRLQPGVADPFFPDSGHGTACMGMAGARQNNGIEGSGIAPDCELLAIACALDQTGSQTTLAQAIQYAVNPQHVNPGDPTPGAHVISCSLDTAHDVETVLRLAIDAAASARDGKGVPIFWAVNNVYEPVSADELCSLQNVIAVGRSGVRGRVAVGCAYGPKLEFLAPGLHVLGPLWGSNADWSGTSFATPLAAGVAALVLEKHPEFTAADVLQRLRTTCDMPGDLPIPNNRYGHGRINAYRAVHEPA